MSVRQLETSYFRVLQCNQLLSEHAKVHLCRITSPKN